MNFKKITALATAGVLAMSVATTTLAKGKGNNGKGQAKKAEKQIKNNKKGNSYKLGNGKTAKNVIVMIADGWGENQILAANYFNSGKAVNASYEKFPLMTWMSTYSVGSYDPMKAWSDPNYINISPTDSAAAGTAMSTGVKTYDAAIGVDMDKKDVKHISEYFEEEGRASGVVSSVMFYHATPASQIAHDENRNNYSNLIYDMLYDSAADVVIGAGHPGYDDNGEKREMNYSDWNAMRTGEAIMDGETMYKEVTSGVPVSDADGDGVKDAWSFVDTKEGFQALAEGDAPDRLFGLANVASTLQQSRGGDSYADAYEVPFNENVPTLVDMSKAALNVLDNNDKGFFLMIEGGAVDWAGHANQLGRNIEEMNDFNDSVDAVIDWVEENSNWGETLLIVTGDHETGYMSGNEGGILETIDNNGAGNMPSVYWNSGNHTNQLVPLYAKGAGSNMLRKYSDEKDPVRKSYMDNTEIIDLALDLLK